jgi:hypothetical protein
VALCGSVRAFGGLARGMVCPFKIAGVSGGRGRVGSAYPPRVCFAAVDRGGDGPSLWAALGCSLAGFGCL